MEDSVISKVVIKLNASGFGTVEVDGHEIGNKIRGMNIKTQAGEPTQALLTMAVSEVEIEADAEVVDVTNWNDGNATKG